MDDSTACEPRTPLPRWTVPLVAALAVFGGLVVLVIMWRWIDDRAFTEVERTSAQIEAVKLASGIVIGGGGLFALYLAARRQRTQEMELEVRRVELAQRDRAQAHVEQIAEDARQDAADHRAAELYTKAADQLGSDKAPVRLAGLYALERLGQGNPGHRQTVMDVICAYLRMPYTPPDEHAHSIELIDSDGREELQVRTTAQSIIANHLRETSPANRIEEGTFWSGIHLDLKGAHLVDFALADAKLDYIELSGADLTGSAVFCGMRCNSGYMQGVTFRGHADFRGVEFVDSAWISFSNFDGDVWFHGDQFYGPARFGRHVSFQRSTFRGKARFDGAVFTGSADFGSVNWLDGTASAEFRDTVIEKPDMTSPEVGAAASIWPGGWRLEMDDHATLKRA